MDINISISWLKTLALGPLPYYSAANGRNRERRPIVETLRPLDDGAPLGVRAGVGLLTL